MPAARRPSGRFRPDRSSPHPEPGPAPAGEVLLLAADLELVDAVDRLAAAAGCDLRRGCAPAAQRLRTDDPGPELVLVGADADPDEVTSARAGAAEVVLVGCAPVPADWWQAAARFDVDHAVVLPEAEPWLLDRLVDAAEGPRGAGRLVGVVGGSGGAGASLVAAALATAAAEAGDDVLLLDADPRSGGADLLLGADRLPGLRWGDLAGVTGRLRPDVLRACVDVGVGAAAGGSLRLLSGDRSTVGQAVLPVVPAVVEAARRTFALTVLDLPRGGLHDVPDDLLAACEEVLVVLPATSRAAAAACTVVDDLRRVDPAPPVRIVLRDIGSGALTDDLADAVGAPAAGILRPERDLDAGLERGEGLPLGRRSGLRGFAARWAADTRPVATGRRR